MSDRDKDVEILALRHQITVYGARTTTLLLRWAFAGRSGCSVVLVDQSCDSPSTVDPGGMSIIWLGSCMGGRSERVGAEYRVASCDLGVLMQEAAEPVSSGDLDVGVDGIG